MSFGPEKCGSHMSKPSIRPFLPDLVKNSEKFGKRSLVQMGIVIDQDGCEKGSKIYSCHYCICT